jgi:endonuclease/exonuclease/phosphatase family metal-dependent hydrolase
VFTGASQLLCRPSWSATSRGPNGAAVEYLRLGFRHSSSSGQPLPTAGRSGQFTQELDHILFDPSFEPLNSWVVNAGASDHLPVMAHLEAAKPW